MALTKKTTDRTGLGRMVVYMEKGIKTTESVFCARKDAARRYSEILQINGDDAELKRVVFNGVQIYPEEILLSYQQLSEYLPLKPSVNTIKKWVTRKTIPFHKRGQAKNSPVYFKTSEIDKWIKEKDGKR